MITRFAIYLNSNEAICSFLIWFTFFLTGCSLTIYTAATLGPNEAGALLASFLDKGTIYTTFLAVCFSVVLSMLRAFTNSELLNHLRSRVLTLTATAQYLPPTVLGSICGVYTYYYNFYDYVRGYVSLRTGENFYIKLTYIFLIVFILVYLAQRFDEGTHDLPNNEVDPT